MNDLFDSLLDWSVVLIPTLLGVFWQSIEQRVVTRMKTTASQRLCFLGIGIVLSGLICLEQHLPSLRTVGTSAHFPE